MYIFHVYGLVTRVYGDTIDLGMYIFSPLPSICALLLKEKESQNISKTLWVYVLQTLTRPYLSTWGNQVVQRA